MPIRGLIVDFGGVIVRTEDWSSRQQWEARLGLPPWELSKIVFDSEVSQQAQLGQASVEEIWQHVAETLELDDAGIAQLQQAFWDGDQIDTTLVQFIRGLRPRYKTAILSNAWPDAREAFVEHFGLGDAVDAIVVSSEEGIMKPDPRIYRIAAGRLDIAPEEAIFVDDMAENVEGARAVGMRAMQFESTPQVIAEVRRMLDEGEGVKA